jgi:hypothetical protein
MPPPQQLVQASPAQLDLQQPHNTLPPGTLAKAVHLVKTVAVSTRHPCMSTSQHMDWLFSIFSLPVHLLLLLLLVVVIKSNSVNAISQSWGALHLQRVHGKLLQDMALLQLLQANLIAAVPS